LTDLLNRQSLPALTGEDVRPKERLLALVAILAQVVQQLAASRFVQAGVGEQLREALLVPRFKWVVRACPDVAFVARYRSVRLRCESNFSCSSRPRFASASVGMLL
jgi:hypothetical protein